MDYIIFLATIQVPFLYLVWRLFQTHGSRLERETREKLRQIDSQQKRTSHLVDVFKMTLEKSQADLTARISRIEARLRELEKYTGLRTESPQKADGWPDEAPLRDKDFV